jgi:hypothetical protein
MGLLHSMIASLGPTLGARAGDRAADFVRSPASAVVLGSAAVASAAPPIIQPNTIPVVINPSTYSNAFSPTNPNGSLLPLFAFRSLVDPVPMLATSYTPSATSTEVAFGNLLDGASVPSGGSSFAQQVLASARQQFALVTFPSLDGTPGSPWRPVYADPSDWYAADASRFQPITIANQPVSPSAGYSGGNVSTAPEFAWRVLDDKGEAQPLDPDTQILSASFRYLEVTITRPWFDFTVFRMGGWVLQGEPAGLYSTGDTESNDGLLPLIPVTMILGINAQVTARLGAADRSLIQAAASRGAGVALGPFPVSPASADDTTTGGSESTLTSTLPFIAAWVSTLVPLAPAEAG